jgi:hypothetical protein
MRRKDGHPAMRIIDSHQDVERRLRDNFLFLAALDER